MSALIAELFRAWYATAGARPSQLLVSSFLLMDPVQAIRTGSVPYWALFGGQPSLDWLAGYLESTEEYDDIRVGIFPHGTESAGLPRCSSGWPFRSWGTISPTSTPPSWRKAGQPWATATAAPRPSALIMM